MGKISRSFGEWWHQKNKHDLAEVSFSLLVRGENSKKPLLIKQDIGWVKRGSILQSNSGYPVVILVTGTLKPKGSYALPSPYPQKSCANRPP